ncbi:MAG: adhesin [Methanobrevibacter sp.]|uniref:Adhesin n=1 Tax=Methanobrevibacter millerae TaxID=230361 RepID=A0A8T3VCC1_9EURY|nr:adhesin [Methanobrevibacter millerae]MBE6505387.1 adhesin [Methanobrevibacter millerae]MBR0057831.1 adhesin [Methanobrevibacter sp.]
MKFKNIFLITVILLAIFSISSISAEEIADNEMNIISEDINSDIISIDDVSGDNLIQKETSEGSEGDGNGTSSIQSTDLVKYYKNDTQYEATFFDGEGNPLIAQKIPINIHGENYTRTTNENGTISFSINLGVGNYTISVTNPATNETASNKVTVLSTLKANDLVKTYRNATQFEILVLNGQGNPLANTVVTFNINGVFYNRTSKENGIASLNINLEPKTYVITAVSGYNGETTANTITVLSSINAKDIKKYYRNDTQYNANFTDSQGNPLTNTTVTFNINGVFYNRTTNENGTAKLNINLEPGNYILTAFNPVTQEYKGNNIQVLNLIVVKNTQSGGNISMEFNSGAAYTVEAHERNGSLAKNKALTFNINGVLYKRTTNENGTTSLNINLEPGNYIITTEFEGCRASNLIKVRVTPNIKLVSSTIKYGQPFQFILTQKNTGYPITGNHYGIIIYNDTPYGALPDANGLVQIGQQFPVGFSDFFLFGMTDDGYYSSMWNGNTIKIVE